MGIEYNIQLIVKILIGIFFDNTFFCITFWRK